MPVKLKIKVTNTMGILAHITNLLYEMNINLTNLKIIFLDKSHEKVLIDIDIEVSSRFELEKLIGNLKKMEEVLEIERGKPYYKNYKKNRR